MCRMAAYLASPDGPALAPAALIYDAPHGLEHQACVPREMVSGTVNVDGTGVAWWREGDVEPLRYVTTLPPWSDPNLEHLGRRLNGRAIVAAVRSATPGIPGGAASVAPFVDGRGEDAFAMAHNGYLKGFGGPAGRQLIDTLPDELHARLQTRSDSLAIFLLAVARRRERAPQPLDELLAQVVNEVEELARAHGVAASLNLLACDGKMLSAVRAAVGVESNSLYGLFDGARWPGATLLASEPLDDDSGWVAVPDRSRVLVDGDSFVVHPL